MPTGHVMLQEFSDSLVSLNFENELARPIEFRRKEEPHAFMTIVPGVETAHEEEEEEEEEEGGE